MIGISISATKVINFALTSVTLPLNNVNSSIFLRYLLRIV